MSGSSESHTGALMKFFLDCNDDGHRRASFEGFKESTAVLQVRGFVGLKDGTEASGWDGVMWGGSPLGGSREKRDKVMHSSHTG